MLHPHWKAISHSHFLFSSLTVRQPTSRYRYKSTSPFNPKSWSQPSRLDALDTICAAVTYDPLQRDHPTRYAAALNRLVEPSHCALLTYSAPIEPGNLSLHDNYTQNAHLLSIAKLTSRRPGRWGLRQTAFGCPSRGGSLHNPYHFGHAMYNNTFTFSQYALA